MVKRLMLAILALVFLSLSLPLTALADAQDYIGMQRIWIRPRMDMSTYFVVNYELRGVGDNVEVWVSKDVWNPVNMSDEQVQYIVDEFDNNIFPIVTGFYGQPDSHDGSNPTYNRDFSLLDGIERVVILIDNNWSVYDVPGWHYLTAERYTDRNVIGLCANEINNRLGPDSSSWRETDADKYRPYYCERELARELAHIILFDRRGIEDWSSEALASYAAFLCGRSDPHTDYFVSQYLLNPQFSLVDTNEGSLPVFSDNPADIGQPYLFMLYLEEHYGGEEIIEKIRDNPKPGIQAVNEALVLCGYEDITFETVFRDWTVANAINSRRPAARYYYSCTDNKATLGFDSATPQELEAWAPHYYHLDTDPRISSVLLNGTSYIPPEWQVVQDPLVFGNQVFFSGNGNLINRAIFAPLDLTAADDPVLSFDTLYNIETDWDFGMVQVSTNNGATWQSLANANTTFNHHPNAYPDIIANLPGFSGYSGGWTHQEFDLSSFSGQKLILAFRYMTDWNTEGANSSTPKGFLVDNVAVSGTDFYCDGSSYGLFGSLEEAANGSPQFLVSFIGVKQAGSNQYKVHHLGEIGFPDGQEAFNEFIRSASLQDLIMVVTSAAPVGSARTVDFEYVVERDMFKTKAPKK